METIEVKPSDYRHGVSVEVLHRAGVWVVHRSLGSDEYRTVTHAPTGLAVRGGQPHEAAVAIAEHLAAHGWAEWNADGSERRGDERLMGAVHDAVTAVYAEWARTMRSMDAMLEHASPAPWQADVAEALGEGWPVATLGCSGLTGDDWCVEVRGVRASEMDGDAAIDARLIAAMRNRVPGLLRDLAGLLAELPEAHAERLRCALERFEEGP